MKKLNGVKAFCAATLGLTALFTAAAGTAYATAQVIDQNLLQSSPVSQPGTNAEPGHTYWQEKQTGTILDVWRCPETGVCLKTHFVDPANKNMRDWAAWGLEKKIENLTDDDVNRFCGFGPRFFNMTEDQTQTPAQNPGKWKGNFKINLDKVRGIKDDEEGRTFGVEIDHKLNNLRFKGWWDAFLVSVAKRTYEFTPVTNPPPACKAPPAPAPQP